FVPWTPTPAPTLTPTSEGGATAAPVPSGALTWDATIGPMLQTKCSACHGAGALGGLNLSTYADAMQGGASGPVILPGDSANSLLVAKQQAGGHPGQLTPEEIAQIIEWIDAGAPEN
ncbi:MAG TPA: c-type cytochrome domain-containing protein, partial [Anaerolineales bacterium]